jgi:3-deoxy-manno-octulosonate cytidylyltransferase (CMP-KDO synthetase)
MKTIIIIPARYKSSRFPGKPLKLIHNIPMIVRVWSQCTKALAKENIYVATDDEKIKKCCIENGIQYLMTSDTCLTGTDRVHEASQMVDADLYINVQGDEPLIDPLDIKAVIKNAEENPGTIINAMCKIKTEAEYRSLTVPKVVFRENYRLLYMSRSAIPGNKDEKFSSAWKQVCIYAFNRAALDLYAARNHKTLFEDHEDIEILRFLEIGMDVKMVEVSESSIAVDIPTDITRVELELNKR